MSLTLIAAATENNVIGHHGTLPWKLAADMKRFRELTRGSTVIMGRKTYESIGRPLPQRTNIIITRQPDFTAPGCEVVHSLEKAVSLARSPKSEVRSPNAVFIIGGGDIYAQALPLADRIELTRIHAQIPGDAFFPEIDPLQWREVHREEHPADSENEYPMTFLTYERVQSSPSCQFF